LIHKVIYKGAMMNEVLTVIAHARAKLGKERQAREILMALVAPTRMEHGCIDYVLHQSVENPSLFVFYENWATPEDLDAQSRSPHIVHFRGVCGESLLEPPVISRWRSVDGG
jgi:quinol monooxygenase YgiN